MAKAGSPIGFMLGRSRCTLANGAVLQGSHRAYGWNHVAEYARATNLASVGMLNACGLDLAPSKATFVLDLTGTFHTS